MLPLKKLLVSIAAVSLAAPVAVHAAEPRSVSCSVEVNYLLNGVVKAPYQKEFVVTPGVTFVDDFSTATRFKEFDASTRLEAGNTVVAIGYFNDVGVFESVDLQTQLTLRDDRAAETISGSHTYSTSLGVVGNHTTNYTLTCVRLKR